MCNSEKQMKTENKREQTASTFGKPFLLTPPGNLALHCQVADLLHLEARADQCVSHCASGRDVGQAVANLK